MPTIYELKIKAEELKKKEDFVNALPIYQELYTIQKNEWNGYFLAQCLRKTGNYLVARQLHNEIKLSHPNFEPIKNEELWLDYSEKVKDWKNENLLQDAEDLLNRVNKLDKYTGSIFNKTVLNVVKHLIYNYENSKAFEWINKVDFNTLNNTPFTFRGQKYPSDQKDYFKRYADILIKLDKHIKFIEVCLSTIGFSSIKQVQFEKRIIEEITFGDNISRTILGLYIKHFKEEIYNRQKKTFEKIYNADKITLISDLSNFDFCEVSFAINETFKISSNISWEKDEWLTEKKYLLDRYNEYQNTKDLKKVFLDTNISINDKLDLSFRDIFNARLIEHNYDNLSAKYYSNPMGTIRGMPDYIFESNGNKFVVVEKFTRRAFESMEEAFENDLYKLYGYLFELESLNLSYGYMIYWHWNYEDTGDQKKKIKINNYHIFKVDKSNQNLKKLKSLIESLEKFKSLKKLNIDGEKISYANKCLHCSVMSYCNHKTGKFNTILLPYEISELSSDFEVIL